jgi:hypothetical protein
MCNIFFRKLQIQNNEQDREVLIMETRCVGGRGNSEQKLFRIILLLTCNMNLCC